jgi:hypothetical protein
MLKSTPGSPLEGVPAEGEQGTDVGLACVKKIMRGRRVDEGGYWFSGTKDVGY